MPGLLGWIHLGHDLPEDPSGPPALLSEMVNRIRHTGREVVDTWAGSSRAFTIARVALGRRFAPPWSSTSGPGPVVFLHGTLHGHPASVPEQILALGERPEATLPSLAGSYSVAVWEPRHRRLALAVDRRASHPLVYALVHETLYFAPEVKALLAVPGIDKALNAAAFGLFLGSGYVLGPETLFSSIRRLSGGEVLRAEPGRHRITTYGPYRLCHRGDKTPARELARELWELVDKAIRRNVADADRRVVFLSGGVDSRAIAAVASRVEREQRSILSAVTWATREPRPGSDLEVARQVAERLGARHEIVERRLRDYGTHFTSTNYLLDGLSDIAAYHPDEHQVMRDLAASGVAVVLRGDECFGWGPPVRSVEEGLLALNLRPVAGLRHLGRLLLPPRYEELCDASASALSAIRDELAHEHPDDAKDLLYFRHRLQGYLGSAAYLKQAVMDHRAPLVDESLLAFNARVPAALRADKTLFYQAFAAGEPALAEIPYASRDNLEDFGQLLATRSQVRRFVELELRDDQSGIWEIVDRRAMLGLLPALGGGGTGATERWTRFERDTRRVARKVLSHTAPPLLRALTIRSHRAALRVEQICMRILVLKSFYDLFVTGDGSRRALEERLRMCPVEKAA